MTEKFFQPTMPFCNNILRNSGGYKKTIEDGFQDKH
jgi:hypothetical protein